jgi:hypothetical protein|nr:MAG TPA: hypothetical protein [Caudoviricetes sp.]
MNLLNETLDCLKVLGIDEKDAYGVYDGKTLLNWNDFKKLAKDINYDNGYGCQKISQSLLVYTGKAILYRHEYDGAEGWKYVPILDKEDLLNPKRLSESKILFKDVKFVIGEDYSFFDDNYNDWYGSRYDYENLLDYKGDYII